ncbi:hypothetical protein ACVIQT_002523 [Bradyrhizobium diazoefficiens]
MRGCARDQRLDLGLARDVAGDDDGVTAGRVDAVGDLLAGISLARGDQSYG